MASVSAFVADLQTGPSFRAKPYVPDFFLLSLTKCSHAARLVVQGQSAFSSTRFEEETGEEDGGGSARFVTLTPLPSSTADSTPLTASVDPAAFKQAAPLQDYPEILDDDVPTNLDYLVDALNQTSMRPKGAGRGGSSSSQAQGGLISEVDGETIRMLTPRGIEIVDDWLTVLRVDAKDLKYVFLTSSSKTADVLRLAARPQARSAAALSMPTSRSISTKATTGSQLARRLKKKPRPSVGASRRSASSSRPVKRPTQALKNQRRSSCSAPCNSVFHLDRASCRPRTSSPPSTRNSTTPLPSPTPSAPPRAGKPSPAAARATPLLLLDPPPPSSVKRARSSPAPAPSPSRSIFAASPPPTTPTPRPPPPTPPSACTPPCSSLPRAPSLRLNSPLTYRASTSSTTSRRRRGGSF